MYSLPAHKTFQLIGQEEKNANEKNDSCEWKSNPLAFSQDMVNHRFFSKALDTLPKALEEGLL